MKKVYKALLQSVVLMGVLSSFLACGQDKKSYESPPGYDLNKPYIIKLPSELHEISGIAYYAKDNSLFAESDGKGDVYKISLNNPANIKKWKFSHKRDYEDIVMLDSVFYILNSNGNIFVLKLQHDSLVASEYKFPEPGKNEFESLYYDARLHKLVMLCKQCDADKKTSSTAYTFDQQQFSYASLYTINAKKAVESSYTDASRFKPSGATINPVTGELYILSSVNKLLVVADGNGIIKNVYHLNPTIFTQPEGITFNPRGDLFISCEGKKAEHGILLFYSFKKAGNK